MKDLEKFWIVGGSSGIGLEFVKNALLDNKKIVLSSRNASSNKELLLLQLKYPNNLYLLNLDVKSDNIKNEVLEAWNVFDGLDAWFYNAGAYEIMDINSWDKEKFKNLNQTNYLGVINLMTELIPYFKKQGFGKWIWNLSLSSYFGLPKGAAYSAPKAALLNLAQSIHPELSKENIKLQVINHGFVKTILTAKNDFKMPQLMSPEFTAKKIYKEILKSNDFEIRFPFRLSMFLRLLSILPYKISLNLTKKML